jgi:outer membrane protein assembly factor BamE (lipoprotein component of BamABCDE complex)
MAATLALLAAACSPPRISVPEIDHRRYPDVTSFDAGTPVDSVIAQLGEPSQRKSFGSQEVWGYAIRCCNWGGWGVPAVHLHMTFDSAGILREWGYRDPADRKPLAIRETVAEAKAVEKGFCRPATVDLARLKPGQTTAADVEREMTVVPAARMAWDFGVLPRKRVVAGGEEWTYDADRPSPYFFRPFYYVFEIENGRVRSLAFPAGYGGCK